MITVEMKEKNETTRVLDVVVPQDEVDCQFDKATVQIQRKAALPGFRKGKVPLDIIAKKYDMEIREAVLDQLFNNSYREALAQTNCVPIEQPRLEKLDLDKGKPLSYQVVVEVLPKVKLGNFKGMKLKKRKVDIESAEIDEVLEHLRQQSALLEPVEDRASQKGDVVILDFEGKKDGETVPGTKADGYMLELGSGQTIPDFENNIIGMCLRESKTFSVTFPAEYHAQEMAGQTIEFTVMVKAIQNKKLADLDDAFAKQMGKFETLDELKERIRQDLIAEKDRQNRILINDQIMKNLAKSTQVKVPNVLVERSLTNLQKDYEDRLARQNQTMEQMGVTPEDFKKKNREQVELELKARLALREIALLENIEVSGADMDAEIERLAQSTRQSPETIRNWIVKNNSWEDIRDRLRDEKTQDFIVAHAKITED